MGLSGPMIRDREKILECIYRLNSERDLSLLLDMWLLPVLVLDTNRNSYMESPTKPLDLTLSDLERSKSGSPKF